MRARPLSATTAARLKVLCLALLVAGALAAPAGAQGRDDLVGGWYGELKVSESRQGRPVDFRRWLRTMRADGTYTIVFRFYFDNRVQAEQVVTGVWGYQDRDRIYWTECGSNTVDGQSRPCLPRYQYYVYKLDAREMAYAQMPGGAYYVVTRVPGDYRLP